MGLVKIFDNDGESNRTQILQKLLKRVKEDRSEEEKEPVIIEIANLALRSRPLCRQDRGKPLEGIYQEIYDLVYLLLVDAIRNECEKPELIASITCEWLDEIQLQAFKTVIDDRQLKQLAINAQNHPPNSALRARALTELVKAIEICDRLCRPHQGLFARDFYPLIYEEAVVQTMTYICTHIDLYDPERGRGKFINWVNFKLDKNVLACRKQFDLSYRYQSVSLQEIETIPEESKSLAMADLLYQYIEQDPTGILQKTAISGKPKANFQAIALRRLSGKAWKEIAKEFQVKIPVLSTFYQRNSQKFKTLFQEILEN